MLKYLVVPFLVAAVILGSISCSSTPTPSPCIPGSCPPPVGYDIDQSQLLSQLEQESQPFANFTAHEEIVFSNYTIRWSYNPNMVNNALTCINKDHTVTTELGNLSPIDKPFIVAHELASLVIDSEGYHYVLSNTTDPIGQRVVFHLHDMIDTPLRDSILARYGLNATRIYYTYGVPGVLPGQCGDPSEPILQLDNAFLYVKIVLYWRDVLAHHNTTPDIDNQYRQCFPLSWSKAQEILTIINKAGGYDTPAKEKAIFQKIIKTYSKELKGYNICVQ